jgi:hypothetical protein
MINYKQLYRLRHTVIFDDASASPEKIAELVVGNILPPSSTFPPATGIESSYELCYGTIPCLMATRFPHFMVFNYETRRLLIEGTTDLTGLTGSRQFCYVDEKYILVSIPMQSPVEEVAYVWYSENGGNSYEALPPSVLDAAPPFGRLHTIKHMSDGSKILGIQSWDYTFYFVKLSVKGVEPVSLTYVVDHGPLIYFDFDSNMFKTCYSIYNNSVDTGIHDVEGDIKLEVKKIEIPSVPREDVRLDAGLRHVGGFLMRPSSANANARSGVFAMWDMACKSKFVTQRLVELGDDVWNVRAFKIHGTEVVFLLEGSTQYDRNRPFYLSKFKFVPAEPKPAVSSAPAKPFKRQKESNECKVM